MFGTIMCTWGWRVIADVRRFDSPRQLMVYLGLVRWENSTGERIPHHSITKAGNGQARRVLIEGACTYRFPRGRAA